MNTSIVTKELNYQDRNGQQCVGFLAYPENAENAAGVLVCPEWWGRNDYVERRAKELAEQGYVAMAVDMYGDKKTAQDPATANEYMMATFAQPNLIVERITAAFDAFRQLPQVNADKVAVIGFCYGGKVALDLARSGADVKAVATFHANLSSATPAQVDHFHAQVLVAHGADDSMVSLDDVAHFEQEMQHAKVQYIVDIYPNTKHGFTNPAADEKAQKYGIDLAYNADAEQKSLAKLAQLLKKTIG